MADEYNLQHRKSPSFFLDYAHFFFFWFLPILRMKRTILAPIIMLLWLCAHFILIQSLIMRTLYQNIWLCSILFKLKFWLCALFRFPRRQLKLFQHFPIMPNFRLIYCYKFYIPHGLIRRLSPCSLASTRASALLSAGLCEQAESIGIICCSVFQKVLPWSHCNVWEISAILSHISLFLRLRSLWKYTSHFS